MNHKCCSKTSKPWYWYRKIVPRILKFFVFQIKYENTFRTEPMDKFQPEKVKGVIERVLERMLDNTPYSAHTCAELTQKLCQMIKNEVQRIGYERHRLVVCVYLAENRQQALQVASRCLWDENHDCFATATFSSSSITATATVYGVYFDWPYYLFLAL